jgi:hypothetical protein
MKAEDLLKRNFDLSTQKELIIFIMEFISFCREVMKEVDVFTNCDPLVEYFYKITEEDGFGGMSYITHKTSIGQVFAFSLDGYMFVVRKYDYTCTYHQDYGYQFFVSDFKEIIYYCKFVYRDNNNGMGKEPVKEEYVYDSIDIPEFFAEETKKLYEEFNQVHYLTHN